MMFSAMQSKNNVSRRAIISPLGVFAVMLSCKSPDGLLYTIYTYLLGNPKISKTNRHYDGFITMYMMVVTQWGIDSYQPD